MLAVCGESACRCFLAALAAQPNSNDSTAPGRQHPSATMQKVASAGISMFSSSLQQATATHSLCRHAQSEVLHTRVVLSSAHVARYCPSGDKARPLTGPSWSVLSRSTSPVLRKGPQKSGCGTAAGLLLVSRRRRSGRYPACLLLLLPFRSTCCLLQQLLHAVAADTARWAVALNSRTAHTPDVDDTPALSSSYRCQVATKSDGPCGGVCVCLYVGACLPFFLPSFLYHLSRLVLLL